MFLLLVNLLNCSFFAMRYVLCVGYLPIAKYLMLQAFLQDQDREKKVKKRDRILPVSEGGDVLDRFRRK